MKQKQKQVTVTVNKRTEMKKMIKQIETMWYPASIMLYEIQESEEYKQWGFESFKDYVEKELDISYRTANYRTVMGKAIKTYNIPFEKIEAMGWSKFKEIAQLLVNQPKPEEVKIDEIIDEVKDMSLEEVVSFCKKEKNVATEKTKKVTFKFIYNEEQANIIQTALNEASKIINQENPNLALEFICSDWLLHLKQGANIPQIEDFDIDNEDLEEKL